YQQAFYPKGHPDDMKSLDEAVAALQALDPAALQAFHQRWYGANGMVLAVVGDLDPKRVVEAVRKRLGNLPKREDMAIAIPAVPVRSEPGRQVTFVPDKANVDVYLGHQGQVLRTDDAYYPAAVANFIFGGAASSRLFQHVRDRLGLTYGIYSSLGATHGMGPWTIWMTLNPQNVERAITEVRTLAQQLVEKGVTDEELAAARQTLTGKYKVGLATNPGLASVIAGFESYGFPPDFVHRHPERIEAVTRAQIEEVLKQRFRPEVFFVSIAGTMQP
ncbi:MAG: M16 family metallopeptidase, partial [Myxococcales bacterium]